MGQATTILALTIFSTNTTSVPFNELNKLHRFWAIFAYYYYSPSICHNTCIHAYYFQLALVVSHDAEVYRWLCWHVTHVMNNNGACSVHCRDIGTLSSLNHIPQYRDYRKRTPSTKCTVNSWGKDKPTVKNWFISFILLRLIHLVHLALSEKLLRTTWKWT